MTTPTATIIAFPNSPNTTPQTLLHSTAMAAAISTKSSGIESLSEDERIEYVASILRQSIRLAQKKGVRMASLPPQLRRCLSDLCDTGDPTCRMVRAWLDGNRKFAQSGNDVDITSDREDA